ncbi:hypothetical protein [Myxococcus virescens]|uniref:hypothetical protein n=1 Tax=Myxococcus virescens TaxID=83456 RepID=UPI00115FCD6C|nr:hypothetical protein [Myxococcus virescens]
MNGTELMRRVRPKLKGNYTENTIRVHFSRMAADSTSVIAKVDSGHGYYLRKPATVVESPSVEPTSATPVQMPADGLNGAGIGATPEEKFRALFIKYAELENRFAMRMDHTRAERAEAGVNKWKFPDVVLLDWDVGQVADEGYRLDRNLLEVKRSLGEQPFRLTSVELKVSLSLASFRENFFQCVSNSKWAHHSLLAVAYPIDDTTLVEELRRLGTSYDVTIISYSLDPNQFQRLPSAESILGMSDEEFDDVAKLVKISTVATGRQRIGLDWEHIKDMRDRTGDFIVLFEWIAHCLKEGRPFSHADFFDITEIQRRYA